MRKPRSFLTDEELIQIASRIDLGESPIQIAKDMGMAYATIWLRFREKLKERSVKNANLKDAAILESFKRHGDMKSVQKELGVTWQIVRRALTSAGITPPTNTTNSRARKHWIDEDYFSIINTQEKAYFLGLFYADGCVSIRQNKKRKEGNMIYSANISLQEKDLETMKSFSLAVHKAYRLCRIVYKDGRGKDAYRLDMKCKKICLDLVKLGCHPRKSLTLKFPTEEQVPKQLMAHFLRGYFDGDGSVGIYGDKKNNYRWSIISSYDFAISWRKFFEPIVNSQGYLVEEISKKEKIMYATINYTGIECFKLVRQFFYENATIFMQRKKDKFFSI